MRSKFFILVICLLGAFSLHAGELVLKGSYNGKNLFVQNPFVPELNTFCTKQVLVNDRVIFDNPKTSAFSIDLSYLKIGDLVVVRIMYHDSCEPKIVNPHVLSLTKAGFAFLKAQADNNSIEWNTKGELTDGSFEIEQLHPKKGWQIFGELKGKGDIMYNQYSMEPSHFPGENKYRIKYTDSQGNEYYSIQFAFTSTEDPITFSPSTVTTKITLSRATEYTISDMNGNELRKGNGKVIIVQDLRPGLYFLNIENRAEKFIKK